MVRPLKDRVLGKEKTDEGTFESPCLSTGGKRTTKRQDQRSREIYPRAFAKHWVSGVVTASRAKQLVPWLNTAAVGSGCVCAL